FSGLYQPNTYASLRPGLVWEDPSSAGDASKRVETNRYGMRMGDVSLDKSPGIVRVAVLGDSLPFGWGVPPGQAFPAVLETVLNTGGPLKYGFSISARRDSPPITPCANTKTWSIISSPTS
ncbi:MAG TPA: hypothetical protein PK360_20560, partial [bacterium]|nr:hypothetical protein [bacterium]